MRFTVVFAALFACTVSNGVVIYDAINPSSGTPTYVVASQTQRQSFADDFDISVNVQLTGFQFVFAASIPNRSFDARIRFWDSVNYSATGTSSAVSTQVGSTVVSTINAVSNGIQSSAVIDLSGANILFGAGNHAFTIECLEVGTSNYVTNDEISPVLSAFNPSVGTTQNPHIREGSPGTLNGIWEGQEIRVPSNLRFVAAQIQAVPEPATISAIAIGLLAIRKRRRI